MTYDAAGPPDGPPRGTPSQGTPPRGTPPQTGVHVPHPRGEVITGLAVDSSTATTRLVGYGVGVVVGLVIAGYHGVQLVRALGSGDAQTSDYVTPLGLSVVGLGVIAVFGIAIGQVVRGRREGDDAIDLLVTPSGVVGPGGLGIPWDEMHQVVVDALPLGTGSTLVQRISTMSRERAIRRPDRDMTAREYKRRVRSHEQAVARRTPVLVVVELRDPSGVLARAATERQRGAVVPNHRPPHVRIELTEHPGDEIAHVLTALDQQLGEHGLLLHRR
ncbi:hypothetical protein ACPYO6_09550 [Georgenia sp. Z1344]|uniref:hypothetical protein n=1 Tax=Georgenia sp. Z1344 TaxID=3416706 RepID=UPI003CF1EE71